MAFKLLPGEIFHTAFELQVREIQAERIRKYEFAFEGKEVLIGRQKADEN